MAKYNITEKKEKEAVYRSLVSPRLMDELKEKICGWLVRGGIAAVVGYCLLVMGADWFALTR